MRVAAPLLCVLATPALALTPLPVCEGVEAGMTIGRLSWIGIEDDSSGITIELYEHASLSDGQGGFVIPAAPVEALVSFYGTRVTDCASGQFIAIRSVLPDEAKTALQATEFLREPLQAGQAVDFAQVTRAARALWPEVIALRETEETCGCHAFFPDLRPSSMPDFAGRTDFQ